MKTLIKVILVLVVLFSGLILLIEKDGQKPFIICSNSKQNIELYVDNNFNTLENDTRILRLAYKKYQSHDIARMIPY